jgi:hypothetical protein
MLKNIPFSQSNNKILMVIDYIDSHLEDKRILQKDERKSLHILELFMGKFSANISNTFQLSSAKQFDWNRNMKLSLLLLLL